MRAVSEAHPRPAASVCPTCEDQHDSAATPYLYVVEFVFGNRSRLMWINRSGRGEGSIQAIGHSAACAAPPLPDDIMTVDLQDREVLYRALGVQRLLNLQDAIQLLRSEVKRAGSQRAFARKAGVNVSVVSKTLRGMVLPSEKILRTLKLQVVYLSK
jgi:hypothetical protein